MPRALITGANRGIGLEFARQYSADGWDVIATARHSSAELDGLGVTVKPLDLTDADAVAAFGVEGPLDLFIANAGTSHPKDTQGPDNARDWQAMMMVNAIAPYQLAQALLPNMAGGRKMIAMSSGMGSRHIWRLGALPDQQGGAEHGLVQPSAGSPAARCRLRAVQPRLGEDRHGRPRRRNQRGRERFGDARDDRSANDRR
jgi:NAD(P)-dependent dehydrogenase (short-subunit alcohol dehydrogenase family)